MLFEDELVMACGRQTPTDQWQENYVYIDWGPEFRIDHGLNFPELSAPGLYLELGSLSVQYLLSRNASGYVPRRTVRQSLETGHLKLVPGAPMFSYPAYAVYPSDGDRETIDASLNALRDIAVEVASL